MATAMSTLNTNRADTATKTNNEWLLSDRLTARSSTVAQRERENGNVVKSPARHLRLLVCFVEIRHRKSDICSNVRTS